MADYTNRQIGEFRVITRVGIGGFAEIWKARSVKKKTKVVVIKIVHPEKADDKTVRALFEHEWKVCKDFKHPQLLKYHTFGTHENLPYLAMDFFDGKTLKGLIVEKSPIVRTRAKDILCNIATALAYIHGLGIVHRDLKPENIMVNSEGETRLIDFSIAQTKWQRLLSFSNKLTGTLAYMSPEQLKGKRSTPQSDLYSFGAIIFEMFAGRPPFVGDSQQAVINQHLNANPIRLGKLNRDLSTDLDKLVTKMLAKDPSLRPVDALSLLSRLESIGVYSS